MFIADKLSSTRRCTDSPFDNTVVESNGESGCSVFFTCIARKDGKPTHACFRKKQRNVTLRLAEQTDHNRIKVLPFSHSITPQTSLPVPTEICFPHNISSLVAFCSHLLFPLTLPRSLKRWHIATPKQIVFFCLFLFFCAFSRLVESMRLFFFGRVRGKHPNKRC